MTSREIRKEHMLNIMKLRCRMSGKLRSMAQITDHQMQLMAWTQHAADRSAATLQRIAETLERMEAKR